MNTTETLVGKPVRIASLTKRYGDVVAIDDVSIDIAAGEFCTLLGPSGSGKTTLLKVIAGYEEATRGAIVIAGSNVAATPVADRNIGMVFQNYALFPHMTVAENVSFPLEMRKVPREECRRRTEAMLDLIGLKGKADRLPRQLSGGQQQRVAVARALVFNPDILLMDEPLGALDKNLRQSMQGEIRNLHRNIGVTIIYVTHDQEEAMNMSDRVVVMNHGKVEQNAPPAELYNRPSTAFVAAFLGDCNLFDCKLDKARGLLRIECGEGVTLAFASTDAGGESMAGVRPERIRLTAPSDRLARKPVLFNALVRDVSFSGPDYRVELLAGTTPVIARIPNTGSPPAPPGETVGVSFEPADVFLVSGRGR
jgi:putative spermidine/putrescine transport system ATP-binding protein